MNKKKKKININKKKVILVTNSQPTTLPSESVGIPTKTTCKPKFPCSICKGDHLLKDCLGISQVLEVWSSTSQHPMPSTSGHHTGDTQSTNDSMIKIWKGKVRNPFLLCRDMHLTYLCPHMDEA